MTTKAYVTNIVLLGHLTEDIDICRLSKLISLVYFDNLFNKSNTHNIKINYYGIEGIIVSSNYDNESRGIRKPNNIKSFASFDLQCSNKNVHIKLSKNKITLMGILDTEMVEKAIDYMLLHITMTEENWSKVRYLSNDVIKETILWIKNNYLNYKNKKLPVDFPNNIDSHLANLLYYNLPDYDMTTENYYDKRIEDILNNIKEPIYKNIPTVKKIEVVNRVLNYKLGKDKISLIDTVMKLKEKGNYITVFHNTVNRKAKFMISVEYINELENYENTPIFDFSPISEQTNVTEDELQFMEEADEKKPKFHTFFISQSSSVTQYSPTSEFESIKAYRKFCVDLGYIPVN